MNSFEWLALGLVCFIGALGFALTLLSINERSEGDDAEQRRAVSRPAELDDADQMRRGGLL